MPGRNRTDRQEEEKRRREAAQEREESRQEVQEDNEASESPSAQESPSQADSGGDAPQRPSASKKKHHRDEQTKAFFRKLHRDEKAVDEVQMRLQGYAEKISQVNNSKKRDEMANLLEKEKSAAMEIMEKAAGEYTSEAEALSSGHYRRKASDRVETLGQKADETLGIYEEKKSALEAVEAEYRLNDFEAQMRELQIERFHKKHDDKMVHYREFRSMKYRFADLMAVYRTLSAPQSPLAEERKKSIDARISKHTEKMAELEEEYMPKWERKVMRDKKQKSEKAVETLNSRYRSSMPLIRLLFKARDIQNVSKAEKTSWQSFKGKVKGGGKKADKAAYAVNKTVELKEGLGEMRDGTFFTNTEESDGDTAVRTWLKKHAKLFLAWIMGEAGASKKQIGIGAAVIEGIANWFDPFINAVKLIKNMKSVLSKSKEFMTGEELRKYFVEMVGQSIELVTSGLKAVGKYIGEIPILGAVYGIVKDVMGIIHHSIQLASKTKSKKWTQEEKDKLKTRMLNKRQKYQMSEDTKGLGLYGFMGLVRGKKDKSVAYVSREATSEEKKKRIRIAGDTTVEAEQARLEVMVGKNGEANLYSEVAEMKARKDRGELSEAERKKYYRMKTLRDIREYQEMKEGKHTISKRIREESLDLVNDAFSLAGNISGIFPGIGMAVQKGIGFFKMVMEVTRKATKFVHKRMQASSGEAARKQARNEGMAKNIFSQMLYTAGYLRDDVNDESVPLFDVGPESAKRVMTNMDFLSRTTKALSYKVSDMLDVDDRDSMIDMMANAFTTSG